VALRDLDERSVEPLSTTMTSPSPPTPAIPARAASMTSAMEASSLRQGSRR